MARNALMDFYGYGDYSPANSLYKKMKPQYDAEMNGEDFGGDGYGTYAPKNSLLDNLPRLYGNQPYSGQAPENTMVNNRTGQSYKFNSGQQQQQQKNDPNLSLKALGHLATVDFSPELKMLAGIVPPEEQAMIKGMIDYDQSSRTAAAARYKMAMEQDAIRRNAPMEAEKLEGQRLANERARQEINAAKNPEKPLNEGQANATGYGMRAASAHEIINGIGDNGNVQPGMIKRAGESLPIIGDSLGTLLNVTQSPQQQQIEQAQRDFVNAVLRRESGASISPSEFDNARKQYFPQPGDSPEIVAQKRRNRELSIDALSVGAGTGAPKIRNARERSRVIVEAQIAISKGADPEQVRARLRQLGINDSGV